MSIFTAIGSLVGGLFGNQSAKKREQEARRWQEQMDNSKLQRMTADAKKAGIHPIAALGHSLSSPAPTVIGRESYSDMGQNVGRALDAVTTGNAKLDDFTRTSQALQLERMQLENAVIRGQLVNSAVRTVQQPGNPPVFADRDLPRGRNEDGESRATVNVGPLVLEQHPDYSDADVAQRRYGESADWIEGPLNRAADMKWNYQNAVEALINRLKYGTSKRLSRGPRGAYSAGGW